MTAHKPIETGTTFGHLTIVGRASTRANSAYICKCRLCGTKATVHGYRLRDGHRTSCGCNQHNKPHRQHGQCKTRIYRIWNHMKHRCRNPNNIKWHIYGGRGISVCQEWRTDFIAFHNWSLANGYADHLSIDRINVNGNYEPANCRWATNAQQGSNQRTKRTSRLYKSLLILRMICT